MIEALYQSLLTKLSTITPLFAKALLEVSLKERGLTLDKITPVELVSLIRQDLDPKLAMSLGSCNSILLAGSAQVITDENDRIIYLNSAAKQILSVLQADSPGKEPFDLLSENGFLKPAQSLKEIEVREFLCPPLVRTYNVALSPLLTESGETRGTVCVVQDITLKQGLENSMLEFCDRLQGEVHSREEAEKKLAAQFQRGVAASKMAALGEMAGGIAHEINTPLAIIGLASEKIPHLVMTEPIDRERIIEFNQKIERTVKRISKIVSGLRAFSRDGSRDSFQKEDLRRIIDDTLTLCSEKLAFHQVRLLTDEIPEALSLECRAIQVSQILLNLLGNAHDAVAKLSTKWIRLSVLEQSSYVEISVSNSGPPIAPSIQDRLFEPFFTTKTVGKGTGLGLSISKGIAEDHGGKLFLDKRSPFPRFVLRLPRVQV